MKDLIVTSEGIILSMLTMALHADNAEEITGTIDWQTINDIARKHAIIPLILHTAITFAADRRPPDDMMKGWKSYTINAVVQNERSMLAQAEVVSALQAASIPCAILKGASVATLYPRPEMRVLGDIDILVREDHCAEAVKLIENDGYRKHESDHAFHIGFDKAGTYLELHYAVTQFPDSAIGRQIKVRLHDAVNRVKTASIDQYTFPVLAESDQALSLLLHMERHMVDGGIGLRQLCDWCVFIDSLKPELLQNEVIPAIRECQLFQFASTLTRICVAYLGLDGSKHQWCMHVSNKTANELLEDILDSGNIISRNLERAASSTFIKGEESSDSKQSMFSSAVKNLTLSAKKQFPICNKLPVLLPVFWVYIPVRYLYRSMKGTRPKQSVRKIAGYAMKRKRLYRKLELFKR
jgi:hypothetical protein